MKLKHIEVFRAVMLTGSITDAAALLNVTQPGVSRTIKHFELQLKVRLFERMKGRLLPTREARLLFERVQAAYRGIKDVEKYAATLAEGAHSMLRVVGSPSLTIEVVPAAIAAMLERSPSARFTLEVLPSPALVDALVTGQADVGVCAAGIEHPMLRVEKLVSMEMVCVMRRGCPLAGRKSISPRDVSGMPFIGFDDQTFQGRQVANAFRDAGTPIEPVAKVRFARTAGSLVAAGVGIAFVDRLTAAHAVRWGMEAVPVKPAILIPISVATPLAQPLSTVTEGFIADVTACLGRALGVRLRKHEPRTRTAPHR